MIMRLIRAVTRLLVPQAEPDPLDLLRSPTPRRGGPLSRRCARLPTGLELTKRIETVQTAQLRFAFDLHRAIAAERPNRLTAPFSAYAVLALVAAGAKGETGAELQRLLFGDSAMNEGLEGVAAMLASMECPDPYRSTILSVANRVFCHQGVRVLPAYQAQLEQWFDASFASVDMSRPAKAAAAINRWVAAKTAGHIRHLIDARSISQDSRLVLVNAMHVLGKWAEDFDADETRNEPFQLENGERVLVPMMHQTRERPDWAYAVGNGYRSLVLHFADRKVQCVLLLPDRGRSLSEVMAGFDAGEWRQMRKGVDFVAIDLAMPKFALESDASLETALRALGAHAMFMEGVADFSGIDGGEHALVVGRVVQKTFAKVDEVGFEGSAATMVEMLLGGTPKPREPIPFIVDRPFAFVVLDNASGAILFVGEVRDPR